MAEPAAARHSPSLTPATVPLPAGAGDDTPAASAGPDRDTASARLPRRIRWALAASTAVLLGMCALVAALLIAWLDDRQANDSRAAALEAGRAVAVDLATINFRTARQDIQRAIDRGTGEFANQFKANIGPYTDVIKQGEVETTGTPAEAGIERADEQTATIAVALTGKVTSKANRQGEQRPYRMRVDLQHAQDGRWLASHMEFVQ